MIYGEIFKNHQKGMLQISNVQEQGVETLVLLQKLLLVLASCSGEVPGKEICKYMGEALTHCSEKLTIVKL